MNEKISNGVKCALCGYIFSAEGEISPQSGGDEKNTNASCKGCLMARGCNLIRCPNCGYETPQEPKWLNPVRNKISAALVWFSAGICNGVKKILKILRHLSGFSS